MKVNKKLMLRLFLVGEVIVFVGFYFLDTQGLQKVWALGKENKQLALSVVQLSDEVKKLEEEVMAWEQNPFYKEKIAREQLQMARPEDEVYFLI